MLDDRLKGANSTTAVREAFRKVRQHIDDMADEMTVKDLSTRVTEAKTKSEAEGMVGVIDVLDVIAYRDYEFNAGNWIEKQMVRQRDQEIRALNPDNPDRAAIDANWKSNRRETARAYARQRKLSLAGMKGVLEAYGLDHPTVEAISLEDRRTIQSLG